MVRLLGGRRKKEEGGWRQGVREREREEGEEERLGALQASPSLPLPGKIFFL